MTHLLCHVVSDVQVNREGDLRLQFDTQLRSERESFEMNCQDARWTMDGEDLLRCNLLLASVNKQQQQQLV